MGVILRRVFPVFLTLLVPVLFCGTPVSVSYIINNFYLNKFASNCIHILCHLKLSLSIAMLK